MDKPLPAHPKTRYVLPSVAALVLLALMYMLTHATVSLQLGVYSADKAQTVGVWVAEGMPGECVDRTIGCLGNILARTRALIRERALVSVLYTVVAMLAEGAVLQGKHSAVGIAGYAVFAFEAYDSSAVGVMRGLLPYLGTLPLLSVVLAVCLFLYLTRKRMTRLEQMLYGIHVASVLFVVLAYHTYDPLQHTHGNYGLRTPLAECRGVRPELRGRILELAAGYGVEPSTVFVEECDRVNACARSGPRFKTLSFTTKIVEVLTDDQLMAVLSHELGHIANSDCRTLCCYFLAGTVAGLLCAVGTYKAVSGHCNGVAALVVLLGLDRLFSSVFLCLFCYCFSHGCEFRADRESLKNGYAGDMMECLRLMSAMSQGVLFDYRAGYFGIHATHPSSLSRIKALRSALAAS